MEKRLFSGIDFLPDGPMASKPDVKKSTEAADAVEGRTIPQCKPCSTNNKTTAAQVYCHDCKEFQCSECSDHHNAFAFMSGHNIVDWKLKDPEEKALIHRGTQRLKPTGTRRERHSTSKAYRHSSREALNV
ncbi:hypothetical protein MAR_026955 [Mya arenaria]|uniref:B box-type domain-containing protein n=1 Tax=Mya arenaria TaxID=6604 RepID=A0ABY7EU03_MYAAR|nr:hypothetical protein MAR_026955 [Mya arenaria]